MVVWSGSVMMIPRKWPVGSGNPYVNAFTYDIRLNIAQDCDRDPVVAGPFPTLDAAKAAFLVIYGGGDGG